MLEFKKRRRRRKYAHLLIESNLVLIVLNAIYLVLDLSLNFFLISSYINWFLYQVWSSFFYCCLLFFFIIFLIEIIFQFIPRHLISFYFSVKFGLRSFQFYFIGFGSFFSWIYFFQFHPLLFDWFENQLCYFFGFAFYSVIWSHDMCHVFEILDWVDFNFFRLSLKLFFLFHL
jgi:hypothetical protein